MSLDCSVGLNTISNRLATNEVVEEVGVDRDCEDVDFIGHLQTPLG